VVVTLKTGANDGFRLEGRNVGDGSLIWMQDTDYTLPAHGWFPSCGASLTPSGGVVVPAAGGTVLWRASADSAASTVERVAFFGLDNYNADPAAYNDNVKINTPITCDSKGDLYFGFVVTGPTPLGLQSGIARITSIKAPTSPAPRRKGLWISAAIAAGDANIEQVVTNCAPALSHDGTTVYVACRTGGGSGYLLALESAGKIDNIETIDAEFDAAYEPDMTRNDVYAEAIQRQKNFYQKLC